MDTESIEAGLLHNLYSNLKNMFEHCFRWTSDDVQVRIEKFGMNSIMIQDVSRSRGGCKWPTDHLDIFMYMCCFQIDLGFDLI